MTCIHLQKLYEFCQEHDLKLAGADLIRVVCNQCGEHEVCPSTLMDEYDAMDAVRRRCPTSGVPDSPRSNTIEHRLWMIRQHRGSSAFQVHRTMVRDIQE
jgi:hypothetical protein